MTLEQLAIASTPTFLHLFHTPYMYERRSPSITVIPRYTHQTLASAFPLGVPDLQKQFGR
jgi:hypothetical protein